MIDTYTSLLCGKRQIQIVEAANDCDNYSQLIYNDSRSRLKMVFVSNMISPSEKSKQDVNVKCLIYLINANDKNAR